MEDPALNTKARTVLAGSYSSPLSFCAETSPRSHMTNEVTNCVAYGRFRWHRPNAWTPLVNGPKRCHIGKAGTVFATGTGELAGSTSALFFCVLLEVGRVGILVPCRYGRRSTTRLVVLKRIRVIWRSVTLVAWFVLIERSKSKIWDWTLYRLRL